MNEIAQEEMGPEMAVSPAMEVGSVVGEVEEEAGDPVRDVSLLGFNRARVWRISGASVREHLAYCN